MKILRRTKSILSSIYISAYFSLLFVIVALVYTLSAFLYINKPNKVEPQILYYYSFSHSDSTFIPEIRNMNKTGNIQAYLNRDALGRTNIEDFISELMMGPQNIYAEPFASKYTTLENVYYTNSNKEIYIILQIDNEFEFQPTAENKEKIKNWFEKNITRYFLINDIHIIYS